MSQATNATPTAVSDVDRLRQIAGSLHEAADLLERRLPIDGGVATGAVDQLTEDAWGRFAARLAAYETEPHAEAQREAVLAAVGPLAAKLAGIESTAAELWGAFRFAGGDEAAFRAAVTPVVAAVGPSRRNRLVLKQIAALVDIDLTTTEAMAAAIAQIRSQLHLLPGAQ